MKMDAIAPVIVRGTRIYLASGAGGFDVRDCPNAEQLASKIGLAVNAHDALVSTLESVLPILDDLAATRGLSYSEAGGLAEDVRAAIALARKGGE